MAIHKGNELSNVRETWNQNERATGGEGARGTGSTAASDPIPDNELGKTIKKEASEYDNANKTERTLGGDRASVNDDDAA